MKSNFISFFVVFAFQSLLYGQIDSIQHLEEVYLKSFYSPKSISGFSIQMIPDSVFQKKNTDVISLLQSEFNLYFKQYGNGMLASISSRGTGASQTAVFWNNIPVNSNLNGQTDFNMLNCNSISNISYRKSGSSTLLGSGAIAGSINFSNNENFNHTHVLLNQKIGSFQDYQSFLNVNYGTEKQVFTAGIVYEVSENNFEISNKQFVNENAQYRKTSFQMGEKLRWKKNQVYFRSLINFNDRNNASSLYSISNSKLKYDTHYYQLGWTHTGNISQTDVKFSYIKEDYTYINNRANPENTSFNASEKWFQTTDYQFNISKEKKIVFGYVLDITNGIGDAIGNHSIQKGAIYALWHQDWNEKLSYNFSSRKEWSTYFEVPILFSIDGMYRFNLNNSLLFNVSNNFKSPTLNDLFWNPGGNPDLKPEKSLQLELGFQTIQKLAQVKTQIFLMQNRDYIQWRPDSSGNWQPLNIQKTQNYGLEIQLDNLHKINHLIHWNLSYSFTHAVDQATQKQLFYVPYHLIHSQISYRLKKWDFSLQSHYNGGVYTTSDHSVTLPAYTLHDFSINRILLDKKINLQLHVKNVFNSYYEVISGYPMPGRHYGLRAQFSI